MSYLFTSESVSCGHPDKVADQISDAILDEALRQDPDSRVAIETMVTKGQVFVAGEMTTKAFVDIDETVRNTIREIGYDSSDYGFEYRSCGIITAINKQSPDIAMGVNKEKAEDQGAGDQGMMFGYATNESGGKGGYMPLPLVISREIINQLTEFRNKYLFSGLRPDAKSQVTVEYDDNNKPFRIDTILVSQQHDRDVSNKQLEELVKEQVINKYLIPKFGDLVSFDDYKLLINPTGNFVIGGPAGDTGLTGRKIIADTYGGACPHGGGAFCVDGDTEYLTPYGWKRISDYKEGELIAQWDDYKATFVKPLAYIESEAKNMLHISSESMYDMVLSENHDLVIETSKGNIIKKRCKDLFDFNSLTIKNGNSGFIPVSFVADESMFNNSLKLTDDQIRLQVAYCADGNTYQNRIRIKKDYKINRLEKLLEDTKTEYKISKDGEYNIYYFKPPVDKKRLRDCFGNADLKQIKIIADELVKWDGDNENCYRTTFKDDADFAQFVFMSAYGTRASILIDDRIGRETHVTGYESAYTVKNILYSVYKLNTTKVGIRTPKNKNTIVIKKFTPNDGKMYCFSVSSGMLILRRNNKVFITGNSGKDPSKVDRSGAYMCRYVAKHLVAAGVADRLCLQVSYAIGKKEPISFMVNTYGTAKNNLTDEYITGKIPELFDFTPYGIINYLELKKPVYLKTARFGHFGIDGFKWETFDENRIKLIKDTFNLD